ncbi:hypothetical protein [Lewinella sp. 4G2]|uniref:hypothetical protein n=1 Tax=Lewinella sp. 4G2 TaxID=1803372 RepID=UPI0007B4A12B|nr:hypothetical protein [Lewinella sp. 4G2]OAV44757.1 hypothetical protein A3850_009760 [Lewinella sp. 4G2]
MRQLLKRFTAAKQAPSLLQVLLGTLTGITLSYVAIYSREILAGEHFLDFQLMSNLIWLGIGVVLFGLWEAKKGGR